MPAADRHIAIVLQRPGWVPGLALLWAGLLVGISGIATPVKFLAPSLTLPVALDVGRQTFAAFGRVELGLVVLMALAVIFGERRRLDFTGLVVLAVLVGAQMLWLLPVLDAGVTAIIAGTPRPSGPEHVLYIGAEAIKLLVLLVLALWPRRTS